MASSLFAPTETARRNLEGENVRQGVHVVGNSVIDALKQNSDEAARSSRILKRLKLDAGKYAVLTFHRQENVDVAERLKRVLQAMEAVAAKASLTVVFPIHPRTERTVKQFGLSRLLKAPGLKVIEPTGYLDMLELERNAALVFTDSGGLQEEAAFFQVPFVTLRENTERPETLEIGANVLAGTDPRRILEAADRQLHAARGWPNPYGDGTTGPKIAEAVAAFLG